MRNEIQDEGEEEETGKVLGKEGYVLLRVATLEISIDPFSLKTAYPHPYYIIINLVTNR